MKMSEIKLKPCPFCGNTEIKLWHSPFGVGGECKKCGANSGHEVEFNGETKQDAAEAWNRRADAEKSRAD